MNKSESIANLAKSLAIAQGQMGGAVKGKANPFFKSVYADLSSVVEAIRGPLSENGLSFVQVTTPSESQEVVVETVLMHESGEWLSSVTAIPVSKADAQGYGSAITYAKRYGLQGLLGVPSEDDDGNAAAKAKPNKHAPVNAAMEGVVIPDNIMEELRFLAAELVDLVESKANPSAARDLLDSTRLSEDELPVQGDYLLALGQILTPNSKTRSALKKEGEARRAKVQAEIKAARDPDLTGAA